MSVQAITYVLDHSQAAGSERLVLIALANHACTERAECWPSVRLLARESRCSSRTVQYALRALEHARRIKRCATPGQNGTTRWRLLFDPETEGDRPVLPKQSKGPRGGADSASPDPGEGADSAPGAGSAGAQATTDRGAESAPEGVQPVAPEPSREPSEPSAAIAAAAGEPAATDRSSSDVQEPRREDPGLRYWDLAVQMLTAGDVGFTEVEVEAQRPMILAELRKHAGKLADDWPWKRVTEQVIAGRADGSIIAKSPIGVLAFAVRQTIPTGAPPSAKAAEAKKGSGNVRDGLTIPAATDEAEIGWRQLLEGMKETTEWPTIERHIELVEDLVLPLTLADGVLRITGTQYAMHLLERDAIPVLDSYARTYLNGRVVLVPRDEAAVIA